MPREGKKALHVYMNEDELEKVHAFAKTRGLNTAEYIRHLIQQDMTEHGESIEFKISWGGDRRSHK